MSFLYVLAGVIGLGLLIYLFVALLAPGALEGRRGRGKTR